MTYSFSQLYVSRPVPTSDPLYHETPPTPTHSTSSATSSTSTSTTSAPPAVSVLLPPFDFVTPSPDDISRHRLQRPTVKGDSRYDLTEADIIAEIAALKLKSHSGDAPIVHVRVSMPSALPHRSITLLLLVLGECAFAWQRS